MPLSHRMLTLLQPRGGDVLFDYYVDATLGSDSADGLTSATAWQTLGKVATQTFAPGTRVGLKRGETWREAFYVPTGGDATGVVTYGAYGSGAKPRITGCDLLTGWTSANLGGGLYSDGFETGDASAWSSVVGSGEHLAVTGAAALVGDKGLAITIADTAAHSVRTTTSNGKKVYRARFYVDPNSLTMANADEFMLFGHTFPQPFFIKLQYFTGNGYRLFVYVPFDSGGDSFSYNISDAPHMIEISWKAATTAGANNGECTLWVDGAQAGTLTSIDNDTKVCANFELGAVAEVDAGTSGTFYVDGFASNDTGDEIGATDPTPLPIYQAAYTADIDTYVLLEDGAHLTRKTSTALGAGEFFADNANNVIYIRATDDADPATHIIEVGARYDTVSCDDRAYVTFEGLHFHGAGGQYGRVFGCKPTWNTPSHITLDRCEVSHGYLSGIAFEHADTFDPLSHIQILNCNVHDNLTFGVRIEGENTSALFTDVRVIGNSIHGNGNATFGQFGCWIRCCDAPLVTHNEIYDNDGYLDWSDNLLFGVTPNLIATYNHIHSGNHSGLHLDVGSYGLIAFNLIHDCSWNAIWVEEHQSSEGCATALYHNTCYHNLHGLVFGPGSTIREVSGVTAKNNIFAFNRRANVELNEDGVSPDYLNNVLDYNVYQTDPTDPLYQGEFRAEATRVNKTFSQWKVYTSWDEHSLNEDPLLTNPAALNFTLQAGSPCLDAGEAVGLTPDYAGVSVPQGSAPDIGAYERSE